MKPIASFRLENPINEKVNKMEIVRKTMDLNNPPKPSRETLDRLDVLKDEEIDYRDIPELDTEFLC